MKKDSKTYIPHESSLRDEGLSHLFARLPEPEASHPEVRRAIMSRIREVDARRKRRAKTLFYIAIGLVSVLGLILSLVVIQMIFRDSPTKVTDSYTDLADALSGGAVYLVPCVFFFYLSIDLWLSLRRDKSSS